MLISTDKRCFSIPSFRATDFPHLILLYFVILIIFYRESILGRISFRDISCYFPFVCPSILLKKFVHIPFSSPPLLLLLLLLLLLFLLLLLLLLLRFILLLIQVLRSHEITDTKYITHYISIRH